MENDQLAIGQLPPGRGRPGSMRWQQLGIRRAAPAAVRHPPESSAQDRGVLRPRADSWRSQSTLARLPDSRRDKPAASDSRAESWGGGSCTGLPMEQMLSRWSAWVGPARRKRTQTAGLSCRWPAAATSGHHVPAVPDCQLSQTASCPRLPGAGTKGPTLPKHAPAAP